MNILKELLYAIWTQDFSILSNSGYIWIIYVLACIILFLENGFLPTAFLPGDSLLILLGILISKGILKLFIVIFLLTISTGLGSWVSYLQGKALENNKWIQYWINKYFSQYHRNYAYKIFYHYGMITLFLVRFIAFIRTLLPMIGGLSGLNDIRFHIFNWISACLWVSVVTLIGVWFGTTSIFYCYEIQWILFFILLPVIFIIIGVISLFILNK